MRILVLWFYFFMISGCASFKIYNQSPVFIDIEAGHENVWIGCSDTDLKEVNSLMTFYLLAGETTHEFMFRRVMSVKRCLKLQKEYRALAQTGKFVRLVGIQPMDQDELITDRVPQKFKRAKTKRTWTFIRFHAAQGCESYFTGDCDPKEYWGGIIPPK